MSDSNQTSISGTAAHWLVTAALAAYVAFGGQGANLSMTAGTKPVVEVKPNPSEDALSLPFRITGVSAENPGDEPGSQKNYVVQMGHNAATPNRLPMDKPYGSYIDAWEQRWAKAPGDNYAERHISAVRGPGSTKPGEIRTFSSIYSERDDIAYTGLMGTVVTLAGDNPADPIQRCVRVHQPDSRVYIDNLDIQGQGYYLTSFGSLCLGGVSDPSAWIDIAGGREQPGIRYRKNGTANNAFEVYSTAGELSALIGDDGRIETPLLKVGGTRFTGIKASDSALSPGEWCFMRTAAGGLIIAINDGGTIRAAAMVP